MTVISLELNELNFDYVERFARAGKLPNFARILKRHQLVRTVAEKEYPNLEPWIQWPTVYSGLSYEQHGVFRLGDVVNKHYPQIWEELEGEGLKVGAISPMNAANRCRHPAFFLPDPWTATPITADPRTEKLWKLVAGIVNANASDELGFASVGRQLAPLAMSYVRAPSTARYMRILVKALSYKWAKAAFLDALLFDLAMTQIDRHKPDFTSLFMNAGAHIQHHYTFDSEAYEGDFSNPGWYSKAAETREDPLLFIYEVYDEILGELMGKPQHRVLITTGLSQTPNPREHYQYRIVDFPAFMGRLGITEAAVEPRMSRDFLLKFETRAAAMAATERLSSAKVGDKQMFRIEDRELTLFCQVSYIGRPDGLSQSTVAGTAVDASNDLVLVSIENAIHQTIGYHIDLALPKGSGEAEIPLTEVHSRLKSAALAGAAQPMAQAA
jgi:hypothetical protein